LADLLVQAASGDDVEEEIVSSPEPLPDELGIGLEPGRVVGERRSAAAMMSPLKRTRVKPVRSDQRQKGSNSIDNLII